MIRFLRAFAWLRWRLLLNGVRGSHRRDAIEQISRLLALAVPAAIVVMSLGSILMVSVAGLMGGYGIAAGTLSFSPPAIVFGARALLFGVTVLVLVMPVSAAAQTTSTKYSRLLLLPISGRSLHVTEVLAGLADPWILFSLPGLGLFAIGLAAGGRVGWGLMALAAGAVLVVVLASASAFVSFLVSWLFRNRRRAELLTILFVMSISVIALLPQFLDDRKSSEPRLDRGVDTTSWPPSVARLDAMLPRWTAVLPSEVYGRVINTSMDGKPGIAAAWMALLSGQAALFFWLSGVMHRRLLESAGGSGSGRHRITRMRPPWRLPGVSGQASAVAWVMLKGSMRSVRGRVAVLLPGPMMAIVALMLIRRPGEAPWIASLGTHGHLMFGASLIIAIFAIHPFTLNQFSSDRTGLTLQLLLPVSAQDLVRGKAIGGGAMFLLAAAISGVASMLATGGGSPAAWLMAAVGGLAVYITVTPIAALVSALLPVAADMSKAGSGGNPHTASALIGMLAAAVAAVPVALIAVPDLLPFGTPMGSLLAMVGWLGLVSVVAWVLLGAAARVVTARRENLFLTK